MFRLASRRRRKKWRELRRAWRRYGPNMKSDLTTAMALAQAAIAGALANVEINLALVKDVSFVAQMRNRAEAVKS